MFIETHKKNAATGFNSKLYCSTAGIISPQLSTETDVLPDTLMRISQVYVIKKGKLQAETD